MSLQHRWFFQRVSAPNPWQFPQQLIRRRLSDEAVFALHLVAALMLLAAAEILAGTAWKLVWGSVAMVPPSLPALPFLIFLPASVGGLVYLAGAVHRVYRAQWWATSLHALLITTIGVAAAVEVLRQLA